MNISSKGAAVVIVPMGSLVCCVGFPSFKLCRGYAFEEGTHFALVSFTLVVQIRLYFGSDGKQRID